MIRLSSKGEYATLIMLELALHDPEKYIPLREIASKHGVSVKYLEQIANMLSKGGLVYAARGTDGGYRLKYAPSKYTVLDILLAAESNQSERIIDNAMLSGLNELWQKAKESYYDILRKTTLQDLINGYNDYSV